jgi:hypothetical protein
MQMITFSDKSMSLKVVYVVDINFPGFPDNLKIGNRNDDN